MFKQRFLAYIIDTLIISICLTLISNFFVPSSNYKKLNKELENISQKFIDGEMDLEKFYYNAASISQDLDKENIYLNIIQGFLIIGYFIILPYYYNGQTLGKKMLKIKIVSDDGNLDYNKLIIRTLIINGLGNLFISMALLYLLPSLAYYATLNTLSIITTIIFIVSGIRIMKGKKGIQDILSKTKVVSEVIE